MNRWIIREGLALGGGRYLWDAVASQLDWTFSAAGGGVATVGGGMWKTPPATIYTPWWAEKQSGAMLFSDRREAVRMAARVSGRVVMLKESEE